MGESYYAACQSAQEQDMIEAKAVAPFLKDGEQPSECIKRWRADALAVLELLTQEKVKSETLAAEVAKLRAELAQVAGYLETITAAKVELAADLGKAEAELAAAKAEVEQSDAEYQDAVTLAKSNLDRFQAAQAACAAKDAALRSARELLHSSEWPSLCNNIDTALSTDAGKGWVDASGAVESEVITAALANGTRVNARVPDSWAGKPVLIVPKPEGWK